jgi:hypothetical protein
MEFKHSSRSTSDFKSSFQPNSKSSEDYVAEAKSSSNVGDNAISMISEFEQGLENDQHGEDLSREKGPGRTNNHGETKGIESRTSWSTNTQNRGSSSRSNSLVNEKFEVHGDFQSVNTDTSSDDSAEDARIKSLAPSINTSSFVKNTSKSRSMEDISKPDHMAVGAAIEARCKGKSKFYPGKIIRSRFDGLFDILYDDGERELGVSKDLIRLKQSALNEGTEKNTKQSTPLKSVTFTRNSTDTSNALKRINSNSKRVSAGVSDDEGNNQEKCTALLTELKVGDAVEARYRGKSKLYPGKITRCRFDGSFDILYDDGERELGVAKDLIKAKKDITHLTKEEPTEEEVDNLDGVTTVIVPPSLKVGDAVEARYRGKSKLYPGKITRCRFDGSFDILYDDGERELGVGKDLIKAKKDITHCVKEEPPEEVDNLDGVTTVIVPPSLKVGDAVEARYRGESNFFPGKIIQKHPNGSYDILYDDGDQEMGVKIDLIKRRNEESSYSSTSKSNKQRRHSFEGDIMIENPTSDVVRFRLGASVQARYKGDHKYFVGKIIKCRHDGSFDILYEDGDQEKGVSGDLIRAIDTSTNVFVDQPGEHMSTSAKGNINALQSIRHYMSIIEDAQRKIRTHLDALE